MNIFYRPKYQSDVTQFITQLKAKDPALEAKQREGRELLWDKTLAAATGANTGQPRLPRSPTPTRPTPNSRFL